MHKSVLKVSTEWHIEAAMNELAMGVIKSYMRGVLGHVAEFGTMKGNTAESLSSGITGAENLFNNKPDLVGVGRRDLFLFDSFEGLPETTEDADIKSPSVLNGA